MPAGTSKEARREKRKYRMAGRLSQALERDGAMSLPEVPAFVSDGDHESRPGAIFQVLGERRSDLDAGQGEAARGVEQRRQLPVRSQKPPKRIPRFDLLLSRERCSGGEAETIGRFENPLQQSSLEIEGERALGWRQAAGSLHGLDKPGMEGIVGKREVLDALNRAPSCRAGPGRQPGVGLRLDESCGILGGRAVLLQQSVNLIHPTILPRGAFGVV